MPRHQQVTTCRRGGPLSPHCTCEHCTLSMCGVCSANEGSLTTDCPGTKIDLDRQREVYETPLDYTDARGWHQGAPMERRSPHFTTTRLPPAPPCIDPRTLISPTIDWATIDRSAALQHELGLRAIAWVLADRNCDDLSAALLRAKDSADAYLRNTAPDDRKSDLPASVESIQIDFQRACRLVEEQDDMFRQAARALVATLEDPQLVPPPTGDDQSSETLRDTGGTLSAEQRRSLIQFQEACRVIGAHDDCGPWQLLGCAIEAKLAALDLGITTTAPSNTTMGASRAWHRAELEKYLARSDAGRGSAEIAGALRALLAAGAPLQTRQKEILTWIAVPDDTANRSVSWHATRLPIQFDGMSNIVAPLMILTLCHGETPRYQITRTSQLTPALANQDHFCESCRTAALLPD